MIKTLYIYNEPARMGSDLLQHSLINMMHTIFRLVGLGMLAGALCACNPALREMNPQANRTQTGIAVGAVAGGAVAALSGAASTIPAGIVFGGIAGGAIGSHFSKGVTIEDRLVRNRIKWYRVGDEVELVVPVDKYYYPYNQVLNPRYDPVFKLIAQYIKQYPKTAVVVAGYTDNVCSSERNLALSTVRAREMADYLWQAGVDARLLYAVGYGQSNPISTNKTKKGRSENRRIVISFKVLPQNY